MPSGIEHLCEKFLPKSQPSRPVALQEAAVIQEWESVGGAAESGWHGGDQQMNSAMLTRRGLEETRRRHRVTRTPLFPSRADAVSFREHIGKLFRFPGWTLGG